MSNLDEYERGKKLILKAVKAGYKKVAKTILRGGPVDPERLEWRYLDYGADVIAKMNEGSGSIYRSEREKDLARKIWQDREMEDLYFRIKEQADYLAQDMARFRERMNK